MTESIVALALAAALLTITPGMDTALVMRTAAAVGKREATLTTLGCHTGCLLWGIAAALGLGAIISASELAFSLVKYAGAAYLCVLGIKMICHPRRTLTATDDDEPRQNWFLKGVMGNLLNPKIGIFYVSLPAQVVPAGQSLALWTFGLALLHIVMSLPWALFIIRALQAISGYLRRPRFLTWMDRMTGSLFLLFALKLVRSHR